MRKFYSPWPNSPSSTGEPRGTFDRQFPPDPKQPVGQHFAIKLRNENLVEGKHAFNAWLRDFTGMLELAMPGELSTVMQGHIIEVIRQAHRVFFPTMLKADYSKDAPTFTWADLKERANAVPAERLGDPVRVWGEDFSARILSADPLEEDYYDDGDTACAPLAELKEMAGDDFDPDDHPLVYTKGTWLLSTI